MNRLAPRGLGEALRGLTATIAPASTLARVQEAWERAAGATVAQVSRPTAERDGVVTITCAEAVWAQELSLMESELVARLNAALDGDPVRHLRCRTG